MEKITQGIVGVIIGDALGLPVQFNDRTWFKQNPVHAMCGYGVFNKPKGSWSDDGSLTLALTAALTHGYDLEQIMQEFEAWLFYGKYTQDGKAYDMGQTTTNAIMNYHRGIPIDKCGGHSYYDNGNGSLMRILPLLFYLRAHFGASFTLEPKAMMMIHSVSALTHAHALAKMACGIYLSIGNELCNGLPIQEAIDLGVKRAMMVYSNDPLFHKVTSEFSRLESLSDFMHCDESKIGSSGFVKDTLEASLWCLLNTHSYKEAVLKAVNLGFDTDTTAAVCGGLAALAYNEIESNWINEIPDIEFVFQLCHDYAISLEK